MNKSTKVIITILFTSLLVLGFFFMFLKQSDIPVNGIDKNVTPTSTSTPTPTIDKEELIDDYQLKTFREEYEYRTSTQEDKFGEFIFEYPDTFELTVIEDLSGETRMCNDFNIKNEDFEMTINTNCEPWTPQYNNLPTEYDLISKIEVFGDDGSDKYLLRIDRLTGEFVYSSTLLDHGTELDPTDRIYDGHSIKVVGEDGHFGLLFFINVTIDSENQQNITKYLEIADNIVKSLRSNRI